MADLLDMERAKNLLRYAKGFYELGDMVGVAGLAYGVLIPGIWDPINCNH